MKNIFSFEAPGKIRLVIAAAILATLPAFPTLALAQNTDAGNPPAEVASLSDMFGKGTISGDFRTIYFSTHNAFFVPGLEQNTVSYGGKLGYTTATMNGFSAGISGFIQRGINHSDDPSRVDGYLGPNVTAMGELYLKWQHDKFNVTVGNQQLDVPFASTYDWRMAPQLFQGIAARYGDDDNYVTAFRMFRFKSYIDNSFTQKTTYNEKIDPYSGVGNQTTDGFWGVGGGRAVVLDSVVLKGQAWYMTYLDYARMTYLEGQISQKEGAIKPFLGVQLFYENGDGKELLGNVRSRVAGVQLGVKRNSITASLGYDRIVPDKDSYLNGSLVTPYAHFVSSGPLFAQPFLSSTEDLGAGNAYAFDINGAASDNLFIGARYSYMDLKSSPAAQSLNQSEYLGYAIYKFGGKLKGLSIADFIALQSSPAQEKKFWQNRLTLEYLF